MSRQLHRLLDWSTVFIWMVRMRNKPDAKSIAEIADPNKFLSRCGKAVCDAIGRPRNSFDHCDDLANKRKCYILNGPLSTQAEADKRSYKTVPFFESETERFWLSALVEIEFQCKVSRLAKIGLLLFRGDATDTEKFPLLRAEWDIPGVIEGGEIHAQPHWHIYQSSVDIETFKSEDDFERSSFASKGIPAKYDSEWDEAKKFHFAMASRWLEKSRASHQELVVIDLIPKWMERCLTYIRGQLDYLHKNQSKAIN